MTYIKINNVAYPADLANRPVDAAWGNRPSIAITMDATYAEAMALFHDDLHWMEVREYMDENEQPVTYETDMSEYALAGSVTDNRDGTVTVKMGKYLDTELMETVLGGVPASHAGALEIRATMEKAVQSLPDADALTVKPLYPVWEELVDSGYTAEKAGYKFGYKGLLYKTVSPNTAFASHWVPGEGTESLYVRIDENHVGSADDPIPYEGNMVLENGKYYTQTGVKYLCTRDTVNPVHNALADLVGIYVEVAK